MELDQAIKGIITHRADIHSRSMWSDPLALSDVMLRLATYNSYLADHVAGAHKAATDNAYGIFTEARQAKLGVTEADRMSRGESTASRYEFENVKNIYKATADLITVIQSRLRTIENQLRQEGKASI